MSLVLVADDDPDIVALVRIRLERDGHEVVTATDGHAAWDAIAARRPDLLVVDVMMPRLDGLELTRRLRASPATVDLPIVVISAAVRDGHVRAALDAGADAHVRKPFSPRALAARVDELLAG